MVAGVAFVVMIYAVVADVVVVVVAAAGAAVWLRVVAVARWVLIVWALLRCKVVESC